MSDKAPKWDRSLAYRLTRNRYEHYQDVVDRLMKEEAKLLPVGGNDSLVQLAALEKSIKVVESHGGDATPILAAQAALRAQREAEMPKLVAVQQKLARARECLKWADMASEGMHWLCFSEPQFEEIARG